MAECKYRWSSAGNAAWPSSRACATVAWRTSAGSSKSCASVFAQRAAHAPARQRQAAGQGLAADRAGVTNMHSRRTAIRWVILTIIFVHACMAVTRITASLWVLRAGYGESAVGMMLSLFAVGPIFPALWAGHLADQLWPAPAAGHCRSCWPRLVRWRCWCMSRSGRWPSPACAAVVPSRWPSSPSSAGGQMATEPAELKRIFQLAGVGASAVQCVGARGHWLP